MFQPLQYIVDAAKWLFESPKVRLESRREFFGAGASSAATVAGKIATGGVDEVDTESVLTAINEIKRKLQFADHIFKPGIVIAHSLEEERDQLQSRRTQYLATSEDLTTLHAQVLDNLKKLPPHISLTKVVGNGSDFSLSNFLDMMCVPDKDKIVADKSFTVAQLLVRMPSADSIISFRTGILDEKIEHIKKVLRVIEDKGIQLPQYLEIEGIQKFTDISPETGADVGAIIEKVAQGLAQQAQARHPAIEESTPIPDISVEDQRRMLAGLNKIFAGLDFTYHSEKRSFVADIGSPGNAIHALRDVLDSLELYSYHDYSVEASSKHQQSLYFSYDGAEKLVSTQRSVRLMDAEKLDALKQITLQITEHTQKSNKSLRLLHGFANDMSEMER